MELVEVTPTTGFSGHPSGETEVAFRLGFKAKVPADYAKLLEEKGLVEPLLTEKKPVKGPAKQDAAD